MSLPRATLVRRTLLASLLGVLMLFALGLGLGPLAPREIHAEARYDAIVVLGCRVLPGGEPSGPLRRRTLRAVELYHRGHAKRLVLTGGLGEHPPTESEAAATIAIEAGVPREALLLEKESHSTRENAAFLAKQLQAKRLLLVTDDYHVWRSERVFRKFYPQVDAVGVPSPLLRPFSGLREVGALVIYKGLGWI